jgi:hypothetical protein
MSSAPPNLVSGFKNNIAFPTQQPTMSVGQLPSPVPQIQVPQMQIPLSPPVQAPQMQVQQVPQMQQMTQYVPQQMMPIQSNIVTDVDVYNIFGQAIQKKYVYGLLIIVLIVFGYLLWSWYNRKSVSDDEEDGEEDDDLTYEQQMMMMNKMNPYMIPHSMMPPQNAGVGMRPNVHPNMPPTQPSPSPSPPQPKGNKSINQNNDEQPDENKSD